MSNDKMREEYEAWVLREYPNQHMGRFATGEYHSTVIEDCWLAWRASREALVIELPEMVDAKFPDYDGGWDSAIEVSKECIEKQGLKVKS